MRDNILYDYKSVNYEKYGLYNDFESFIRFRNEKKNYKALYSIVSVFRMCMISALE